MAGAGFGGMCGGGGMGAEPPALLAAPADFCFLRRPAEGLLKKGDAGLLFAKTL